MSYESFDGDDVMFDRVIAHAHDHGVAVSESVLQMLRTAETSQSSIDHHSKPRT